MIFIFRNREAISTHRQCHTIGSDTE